MSFVIRPSYYGKPDISTAAWLSYRGYIISMSTIPFQPEIAIFKDTPEKDAPILTIIHGVSMESILEAKDFVDNLVN